MTAKYRLRVLCTLTGVSTVLQFLDMISWLYTKDKYDFADLLLLRLYDPVVALPMLDGGISFDE